MVDAPPGVADSATPAVRPSTGTDCGRGTSGSGSPHERYLLLVFGPLRATLSASRTPTGDQLGGGQITSASRSDGKGQLQRRLVGLVSDRPATSILPCANRHQFGTTSGPARVTPDRRTIKRLSSYSVHSCSRRLRASQAVGTLIVRCPWADGRHEVVLHCRRVSGHDAGRRDHRRAAAPRASSGRVSQCCRHEPRLLAQAARCRARPTGPGSPPAAKRAAVHGLADGGQGQSPVGRQRFDVAATTSTQGTTLLRKPRRFAASLGDFLSSP